MLFEYITLILVFILIILIMVFFTRYLNYKSRKMLKGRYMTIVESLSLGVNNRLLLIKVENEFFIISVSNKTTELIGRVNIADFAEQPLVNPITEVIDFKEVLKKYINIPGFIKKQPSPKVTEAEIKMNIKNDTDLDGIVFKNNLEKLKNITDTISRQRSENEQKSQN